MKIISHRGYWLQENQKNTEAAFRRSFEMSYGTETDIRDAGGKLVIAHDMPSGGEMTLENFFKLPGVDSLPLALNIKSDGLAGAISTLASRIQIRNWFVFDMSVPDMKNYLALGCPVYCRMSEVERTPVWLDECIGVWLDSFGAEWYDAKMISEILATGKELCVVSSELHGRMNDKLWEMLLPFACEPRLMLCTDQPSQASEYFRF